MTTTNRDRKRLALAIGAIVSTAPAMAFDFDIYEIDASLSTTLTAGIAYRLEDQDKDLISQGNLGPEFAFSNTGASSNNFDDGNLNFEKNEPYSQILRGRSELFLDYAPDSDTLTRVGALVRGTYYYDHELKDNRRAKDPVGQRRELNDEAKDNASGVDLLDAYVFTDWYFGDTPVSIRYGRQVVNWGESGKPCPEIERAHLRLKIAHVVRQARDVVRDVVEASGSHAHFLASPLQRILRDVHTMSGHTVFDLDVGGELYGRLLLGLPANAPV